MNKYAFLLFCIIIEVLIIGSIAVASFLGAPLFYVFYNGVYGLVLSVIIPILFVLRYNEKFSSLGIKKITPRQLIVIVLFVVFSIGGQLIPITMNNMAVDWNLIYVCFFPLLMTTFFEEFLFRGFIQTRLEGMFNSVIAIIFSGLLFSLYHIGYLGFHSIENLGLLFLVGLSFALAYKLGNNSLFVSYFVNLPNAFLTYILKSNQFPPFDTTTTYVAIFTIFLIFLIIIVCHYLLNHKYKIKQNSFNDNNS